ncbi:MAG: M20/M25/M40 family metallo-hydrolase, partial [Gammaproteobacteria bacterium]|nr:M20/M25/M40 family metallo-hydrolase [Gammaproteobacteria bacterium]
STLMHLLAVPSSSCREGAIARETRALLEDAGGSMGIQVQIDDVPGRALALDPGERAELFCDRGQTAPQSGNVIAFLPGDPLLPSWNLSFHLDTNQIRFDGMRRDGDRIRPASGTPLGADDKAGLAIIVEVLRVVAERQLAHGDIRIVGLVAEEDTAAGAQLVDGVAFRGDIVVSIDGGDPAEIGRAAPTTFQGFITVQTETSHPAQIHDRKSVSACAVGARILHEAGFRPEGFPPGHPNVVLHSYFTSCGVDAGGHTQKGHPAADFQYNTISPFWTAAWQMRSLEGPEAALSMAAEIRDTVDAVCARAAEGRMPVRCEITGTERPGLTGYVVAADAPALDLLGRGFVLAGGGPVVSTARQFGGFNGNYIKSRFDEEMIIIGTGGDQAHTNQETVSIAGMVRVARGTLAAMLLSYRYRKTER